MNKVVPTILVMSAFLVMAGCSSSGTKQRVHASGVKATHASYTHHAKAGASCSTCGAGYHAVAHSHGHSNHSTGAVVTHTHTGASGHAHHGMSSSHSYVNTATHAGRNTYVKTGAVQRSGTGMSFAKVAGALLVGGLVYKATQDDDDDSGSSTGGSGGDGKKNH